ncbi:MAG: class I SAM-dependent methyltransferase, partial [Chthoniobacterales bacterium]
MLKKTIFQKPNRIATKKERVATQCVCCGSNLLKKSPAILMPFIADRVFGWQPLEINDSWGLKTIKNGTSYAPCNSTLCTECGFLFLDIRFSDNELASLYEGYRDEKYTALREKYEPGYKERNDGLIVGVTYIEQVEEFLSPFFSFPINILDWGGDTGKNSPFKDKKNLLHIYEINNKEPIPGAELVTKEKTLKTNYDLVVCSHVLEHVPYPSELLLEIKQAMREETILYIELPYEELMQTANNDASLNLKKRHWHEHINFYSEESLSRLLTACGLTIIKFSPLKAWGGANTSYVLQIACKLAS